MFVCRCTNPCILQQIGLSMLLRTFNSAEIQASCCFACSLHFLFCFHCFSFIHWLVGFLYLGKIWCAQLRKAYFVTVRYMYVCAFVSMHMLYMGSGGMPHVSSYILWYEYTWFEITRAMPGYARPAGTYGLYIALTLPLPNMILFRIFSSMTTSLISSSAILSFCNWCRKLFVICRTVYLQ